MTEAVRIKGGTAVITGAASGIGMGLARHAASLGMNLVLADINAAQLDTLASSLNTEVLPFVVDVRDEAAVESLAEAAFARFGHIDMLFNNAGILCTGLSWEISAERWQKEFDVNVYGVLNGLRAFVPRMLKAGRAAHIINTSSVGGFLPSAMMSPYSATKAAVAAITESLHSELRLLEAPITVSLLGPGPVQSAIFSDPVAIGETASNPKVQEFAQMLRSMVSEYGLPPDKFAELVFEGIQKRQFWLFPQPEALDPALRQRMESILSKQNPPLSWGISDIDRFGVDAELEVSNEQA